MGEEVGRLADWQERHRRLFARLLILLTVTLVLDVIGSIAIYFFERNAKGTDVRTFGDAMFFTTVQLLTISSQIKNPLTTGGRIVDIFLELWAITAVAGSAGALATFFQSSD